MPKQPLHVLTVVGARPQFVKAATLSRAIARSGGAARETLVHTGQHFDENMSDVFFREMGIPTPNHHLRLGGKKHGEMTGAMLAAIEQLIIEQKPDWVLVYGDTNSTLAGALAAAKLHVPVAHVEAGLRSFNRKMPEEVNRVLTDHCSDLLLTPTLVGEQNLLREGIDARKIRRCGDVMLDAVRHYEVQATKHSAILSQLGLSERSYILATVHRAENTDDPARLAAILHGLGELSRTHPVVLPLHPRTRNSAARLHINLSDHAGLRVIDPVGYFDMLMLEASAGLIATDSGGVQKEAYFVGVPCMTLRDETEWVELVTCGANVLVGADATRIAAEGRARFGAKIAGEPLYGDGQAAEAVLQALLAHTS